MAHRRKNKNSNSIIPQSSAIMSAGATIDDTTIDSIIQKCLTALRKSFGRPDLAFHEDRRTAKWVLVSSEPGTVFTNATYPVHRLFPKKLDLWLGIVLTFGFSSKTRGHHQLTHVSIIAGQGTTTQSITPFLRAEWDREIYDAQIAPHAQPHWHAYTPAFDSAFLPEDTVKEFPPTVENRPDLRELPFHFAMCASWQTLGNNGHYASLGGIDDLNRWLIGCLSYIQSQVQ